MRKQKQAGFTLSEMMVVIAIIGVLLIIILPNALRVLDTAKAEGCSAYIKTVETQSQLYLLDGHDNLSIDALYDNGYIPEKTCPDGRILIVDANGAVSVVED